MDQILEHIQFFVFCFARVASFIFILPILGNRSVPVPVKIGMSVFLSILIMPMNRSLQSDLPGELFPFMLLLTNEIAIGLTLGFSTRFIFAGIQMAGELAGMQMGLAMAKIVDPGFQSQSSIAAEFKLIIAMLIYLLMSGHHFLLQAFFYSYEQMPILSAWPVKPMVQNVIHMAGIMFESAMKISAPVVVTLLLTNVAFGLLAKTVPQMNILIVGLPLRLGMGLIGLAFTMTLFSHIFRRVFLDFENSFLEFIRIM